jgi:hypothetical protein
MELQNLKPQKRQTKEWNFTGCHLTANHFLPQRRQNSNQQILACNQNIHTLLPTDHKNSRRESTPDKPTQQ